MAKKNFGPIINSVKRPEKYLLKGKKIQNSP
jgi:hypothetical protein